MSCRVCSDRSIKSLRMEGYVTVPVSAGSCTRERKRSAQKAARKGDTMSSYFNLNESLENLVRDLKTGAEQFARAMASEAEAQGKTDGFFGGNAGNNSGSHFGGAKDFSFNFENLGYPRHETSEQSDGSLVYRFQLPGFDESCINLSFRGNLMILKATVPERMRAESAEGRGSFLKDINRREYNVPADRYDQTAVKAVFKNGILTVTIPLKDEDMSGAIKVEIIKEGN